MSGSVQRVFGWLLSVVVLIPATAVGQGNPYLFVLDLQGTALDEFPSTVRALSGAMTVVDKGGQHMLMATSPSEFLITLAQPLPADFTIELDFIPKACCAPDDIMLEGTATMNRGTASAQLTWHPERISAVGGSPDLYQSAMPGDLAASTPGNLTHVIVEFQGTTIKLYTNGRRLSTLDKRFARGRVLRVWLGGESASNPVYLAGLRVGSGPAAPGVIAASAGLPGGGAPTPNPSGQPAPQTVGTSQAVSGGGRVVPNVAVTMGSTGPQVSWGLVNGASSYSVKRWKLNDPCCNAGSAALSGPPWQDVALAVAGTYVYEVTATNPGWTATGQAQFVQFKSPGQIATVAPTGSTAPANPAVSSGVPTVTSGSAAPPNQAISKLLPPPPKVLGLTGISGAGLTRPVPARAIVLSPVTASGGFQQVVPRALVLPGISAAGTGIRTPLRTLSGTTTGATTTSFPAPRTIALAAVAAAGVKTIPLPRTISLTGLTTMGGYRAIAPRVVSLPGMTAAGIYP